MSEYYVLIHPLHKKRMMIRLTSRIVSRELVATERLALAARGVSTLTTQQWGGALAAGASAWPQGAVSKSGADLDHYSGPRGVPIDERPTERAGKAEQPLEPPPGH